MLFCVSACQLALYFARFVVIFTVIIVDLFDIWCLALLHVQAFNP